MVFDFIQWQKKGGKKFFFDKKVKSCAYYHYFYSKINSKWKKCLWWQDLWSFLLEILMSLKLLYMLLMNITHAEMLIMYATYVQQIGLLYITLICNMC